MYKKNYVSRIILLSPAIILYGLLVLYPQVQTLYYSFLSWNGIGKKQFIGLNNFIIMFSDKVFLNSIGNSFRLLFINFIFQAIIAFVIAYILSTGVKGWKFFRFAYFLPVIISGAAIGMIWLFIYNRDFGLIGAFLKLINMEFLNQSWLGNSDIARWAVAFPSAIQWMGFGVVIYMTAIRNIEVSLIESAKIDGAKEYKIMWTIIIPLMKDIVAMNMIFMITGVLQQFDTIWMLTQGGPLDMTHSMATLAYSMIFRKSILGYGSAIALFIFIASVGLAIIAKRLIKTDRDVYS